MFRGIGPGSIVKGIVQGYFSGGIVQGYCPGGINQGIVLDYIFLQIYHFDYISTSVLKLFSSDFGLDLQA